MPLVLVVTLCIILNNYSSAKHSQPITMMPKTFFIINYTTYIVPFQPTLTDEKNITVTLHSLQVQGIILGIQMVCLN